MNKINRMNDGLSFSKRRVLFVVALFLATVLGFYVYFENGESVLKEANEGIGTWREKIEVLGATGLLWLGGILLLAAATGIPPTAPLLIMLGALLGTAQGLALALPTTTVGFLLAFLFGRYLVRRWCKGFLHRYQNWIEEFDRHGMSYLFSVRFIPVFPSTLVSTVVGLTSLSVGQFVVATFLGRIPLSVIYILGGEKLGSIRGIHDLYSPTLLVLLFTLSVGPHLARMCWRRGRSFRSF